ncbi:MAG: DUF1565 domain-containing protein [Verrucomicrobia bacterium]|nr:DUF1565 domain-containing protein [Verrucomicrobiota bacterium]
MSTNLHSMNALKANSLAGFERGRQPRRASETTKGASFTLLCAAVGLSLLLSPQDAQCQNGGISWGHDLVYWFDAQDRNIRSNRFDLNNYPPDATVTASIDAWTVPDLYFYSFDPFSDLRIHSYTYSPRVWVYHQNKGYDLADDFVTATVWWRTSPWPPCDDVPGICVNVVYTMLEKILIDGLPTPEMAGPYRGDVTAFSENHLRADPEYHWGFEAIVRRISPGHLRDPDNSISNWTAASDIIVGDIAQVNYALHLQAITNALQSGKTLVVNHGTYTNLLSDLQAAAQSEQAYLLADPVGEYADEGYVDRWHKVEPFEVHFTDVLNGRVIDGSWLTQDWKLGWYGRFAYGSIHPVGQYRDLARVFNRLVRNTPPPPAPLAPFVTLATPDHQTIFLDPPATIMLRAYSTTSNQVVKVEYYQDDVKIGEDYAWPYALIVNELGIGNYTFRAVVTDTSGMMVSNSLQIIVDTNIAPTAELTGPTNGAVFGPFANIALNASATDANGSVAQVAFYAGTNLLRVLTNGSFGMAWSNMIAGNYSLKAVATDNYGVSTTSAPVVITVESAVAYVSPAGSDANNGLSWETAKRTVQAGIDALAVPGGEVWVAAGIYQENLNPRPLITLYGGFAGNETNRTDRNWTANETVLDGATNGSVVEFVNTGSTLSRIDGFTIRNGNAAKGGGIYCSNAAPVIANNKIILNTGSGIFCDYAESTITNNLIATNNPVANCGDFNFCGAGISCSNSAPEVNGNLIVGNGGDGISCWYGTAKIVNNVITDNSGSGVHGVLSSPLVSNNRIERNSGSFGGGIVFWGGNGSDSRPMIANNLILSNSASSGGGIALIWSQGMIANNTIVSNAAGFIGGGVYTFSSYVQLKNNIIAFNGPASGISVRGVAGPESARNCVFDNNPENYDATDGPTDIIAAPQFVDMANGDFHLLATSPCIDAGIDALVHGPKQDTSIYLVPDRDMDGETRISGPHVDIGADEFFVAITNTAPTLDAIADLTINEDAGSQTVNLTGITSGATNENQVLTVTATASNPSLVPNPAVSYSNPNSAGTLTFTLPPNANGTATITVTVHDGGGTASDGQDTFSRSFLVTVNPVNDLPTISRLPNRTIYENTPTPTLRFRVGDVETPLNELVVSGSSSNTNLVPNENIILGGSADRRWYRIIPATNQLGSTAITISVSDGTGTASSTFVLTVEPQNHAPILPLVFDWTIDELTTLTVTNSATDAESPVLTYSLLVAPSGASISTNGVITWTPTDAQGPGIYVITTLVTDDDALPLTAINTFKVTVNDLTPTVVMDLMDPFAYEDGLNQGFVLITRIGQTNAPLTVNYTVGGTASNGIDYAFLPGSLVIPAGSASAALWVAPVDDTDVEGNESAILTLFTNGSYYAGSANSATIIIQDNDFTPTVVMDLIDPIAYENGPNQGFVLITRIGQTNAPLTVNYTVGGTASNGIDYAFLPGSLVIPAGSSSAALWVSPVNDTNVEGNESVILTLSTNGSYYAGPANSATIIIQDNDFPPRDVRFDSPTRLLDGSVGLNLAGNSERSYFIEASSNLLHWVPLLTTNVDINGHIQFKDLEATNFSSRFYRARLSANLSFGGSLIGWWPGEGNANDNAGTNHGTLRNGTTFAAGAVDQAFSFDGVDDFVEIPDSPLWDFGTNGFSIAMWLNFRTVKSTVIMGQSVGEGNQNKWLIEYDPAPGPGLHFYINRDTFVEGISTVQTDFMPVAGQWYHIVVTRNGIAYNLFIDGAIAATGNDSNSIPNPNSLLYIGQAEFAPGESAQYMDGLIDEVSIYNRVLPPQEVSLLYNTSPLASLRSGLIAYYPFNGNANDASGNGWHGTFVNGTAICASAPGPGEAACLDGVDDYLTLPGQVLSGMPQGTVFAWVYLDEYEPPDRSTPILSKGDQNWTDFAIMLDPSQGEVLYALIGNETMAGSTSIPVGAWVSVAFSWDGEHWRLYANGQLDAEIQRVTGLGTDESTVNLGHHEHCCTALYTHGKFNGFRMYNRALSAPEILLLHRMAAN